MHVHLTQDFTLGAVKNKRGRETGDGERERAGQKAEGWRDY